MLFQVFSHFHNEVERLESVLHLVTVYTGSWSTLQLALGLKVLIVYDEAVSTRAGIHFITLTYTNTKYMQRKRA